MTAITDRQIKEMIKRYKAGESATKIRLDYNISNGRFYGFLKNNGVTLHNSGMKINRPKKSKFIDIPLVTSQQSQDDRIVLVMCKQNQISNVMKELYANR